MPEPDAPVDRRVAHLVGELHDTTPPPPDDLPERVLRTARWQSAARGAFVSASELAGALASGIGLVLGVREQRGPHR